MTHKVLLSLLPLLAASVHAATEDRISPVYGLPRLQTNSELLDRDSKSLLNTFPFNTEEVQLTESLSNEALISKQTDNRGVARTAPRPVKNRVQNNVPQYNYFSSRYGDSIIRQADDGGEDATESAAADEQNTIIAFPDYTENDDTTTLAPNQFDQTDDGNGQDATSDQTDEDNDGSNAVGADQDSSENEVEDFFGSFDQLAPDNNGKKCVNKVILVEETVWDDVEICDHSYDRRCHTSYTTSFEAQQQQECEENYRKNCFIDYEKIAFNQTVKICRNPLVKDCSKIGDSICRTEYESECETTQDEYEVEDDIVDCQEIPEEECRDVVFGYTTQTKCRKFTRNECTVTKQTVKKYTPSTNCKKIPIELCAPAGCGFTEGAEVCYDKVQTIVQDQPSEECNIEPQRVCKHVTKLVPRLVPKEECVDVPKEICSRARRNPKRVKKPMIKKWCYVPSPESGLA